MSVRLKDAPALYEEVNIEVIEVKINNDNNGWLTIPVQDSIYNLLLLSDSANAALGLITLPSGMVSQVRLLLGTHNTVKVGGIVYPLSLSSQDESGLKLNIHQNLQPNTYYTLMLDFDANASIVLEGNGTYKLKPVLSASFQ